MNLITGLGWNERLLIETRGENKDQISLAPGDSFSFEFSKTRHCIGYRAPGSASLVPCPGSAQESSQCDGCKEKAMMLPCLRCIGDVCRNPVRRPDCVQDDNHALYIAAFSPGHLKVGVTKWDRRFIRLAEQGAKFALIVGRDDGQMVRRAESMIRALGIPDRLPTSEKLKAHEIKSTESELREAVIEALASLKARMRARWVDEEEFQRDYRDIDNVRLLQPDGLSVEGDVHETIGQIIVIRDPAGELVAIDGASLTGRAITSSQGSNYQMAIALGR